MTAGQSRPMGTVKKSKKIKNKKATLILGWKGRERKGGGENNNNNENERMDSLRKLPMERNKIHRRPEFCPYLVICMIRCLAVFPGFSMVRKFGKGLIRHCEISSRCTRSLNPASRPWGRGERGKSAGILHPLRSMHRRSKYRWVGIFEPQRKPAMSVRNTSRVYGVSWLEFHGLTEVSWKLPLSSCFLGVGDDRANLRVKRR